MGDINILFIQPPSYTARNTLNSGRSGARGSRLYITHNLVFREEQTFFGIIVPFATPWEICPDIRTYLCAVAPLTTPVRSLVAPAARAHAPRSRGHLAAAPAGPISSKHSRSWWPFPTCAHPCVESTDCEPWPFCSGCQRASMWAMVHK